MFTVVVAEEHLEKPTSRSVAAASKGPRPTTPGLIKNLLKFGNQQAWNEAGEIN